MTLQPVLMHRACLQRDNQHEQVGNICCQVIPEQDVFRNVQKANHGGHGILSVALSVVTGSSASRVPVCSTRCKRFLSSSLTFALSRSSSSSFPRKSAFSRAVK